MVGQEKVNEQEKRKARGARGRGQECSKVVIQWVGKIQEYDHSDRSLFGVACLIQILLLDCYSGGGILIARMFGSAAVTDIA